MSNNMLWVLGPSSPNIISTTDRTPEAASRPSPISAKSESADVQPATVETLEAALLIV